MILIRFLLAMLKIRAMESTTTTTHLNLEVLFQTVSSVFAGLKRFASCPLFHRIFFTTTDKRRQTKCKFISTSGKRLSCCALEDTRTTRKYMEMHVFETSLYDTQYQFFSVAWPELEWKESRKVQLRLHASAALPKIDALDSRFTTDGQKRVASKGNAKSSIE